MGEFIHPMDTIPSDIPVNIKAAAENAARLAEADAQSQQPTQSLREKNALSTLLIEAGATPQIKQTFDALVGPHFDAPTSSPTPPYRPTD